MFLLQIMARKHHLHGVLVPWCYFSVQVVLTRRNSRRHFSTYSSQSRFSVTPLLITGAVQPMQFPGNAPAGLVIVGDRQLRYRLADKVYLLDSQAVNCDSVADGILAGRILNTIRKNQVGGRFNDCRFVKLHLTEKMHPCMIIEYLDQNNFRRQTIL